jgi:hypothetical protein
MPLPESGPQFPTCVTHNFRTETKPVNLKVSRAAPAAVLTVRAAWNTTAHHSLYIVSFLCMAQHLVKFQNFVKLEAAFYQSPVIYLFILPSFLFLLCKSKLLITTFIT